MMAPQTQTESVSQSFHASALKPLVLFRSEFPQPSFEEPPLGFMTGEGQRALVRGSRGVEAAEAAAEVLARSVGKLLDGQVAARDGRVHQLEARRGSIARRSGCRAILLDD